MSSELHKNDFYAAVNQQWLESTRIPDSHSRYGQFDILNHNNNLKILTILQNTKDDIIHPLFNAAMNKNTPIESITQYIDSIKHNLLGLSLIDGYSSILSINIMPDLKNDQAEMIYINEPSLSLPNKQYYTNPKYKHFYDAYTKYVHNTIQKYKLSIDPSHVLSVEQQLATLCLNQEKKRDVHTIYNPFTLKQIMDMYNVNPFIQAIQTILPTIKYSNNIIVTNPALLSELKNIKNIEDFVKWTIYNTSLPYLNAETELHHYNFYGKNLSGTKEMKPLEHRTISLISSSVGDLLGYYYGQKYFTFNVSEKIHTMIDNIKKTMYHKIKKLSWMSDPTKKEALKKLDNMKYKIGVPFKIKDYKELKLSGDLLNMLRQTSRHSLKSDMENLGTQTDPDLWEIGAHEVNAYYSLVKNEIVFPIGILQPPFFSPDALDETNYGAIGAIIGHEISHGFDDQGKKFDATGKLRDWWCPQDKEKYQTEADKMVEQFDNIQEHGFKMNGKLTLGENLADLGGITISLHTLLQIKPTADLKKFFESYAQLWRQIIRKEEIAKRIKSDPHSLAKYRVNQIFKNIPEFYSTYDIQPNHEMYLRQTSRVNHWN